MWWGGWARVNSASLTMPRAPRTPSMACGPCISAVCVSRVSPQYNELDPDTQQFRAGWDALNRFVSYFKVDSAHAPSPHPSPDFAPLAHAPSPFP